MREVVVHLNLDPIFTGFKSIQRDLLDEVHLLSGAANRFQLQAGVRYNLVGAIEKFWRRVSSE